MKQVLLAGAAITGPAMTDGGSPLTSAELPQVLSGCRPMFDCGAEVEGFPESATGYARVFRGGTATRLHLKALFCDTRLERTEHSDLKVSQDAEPMRFIGPKGEAHKVHYAD